MLDDFQPTVGAAACDGAFEMLQELGRNTSEEIRRQRAHFRRAVKVSVWLQPGNASEMLTHKIKGVTGDVSEGGCSALFPIPPRVGDIYRLLFDKSSMDLPLTFARCVRCRLIREDAFEAGFAFFKPICLPKVVETCGASALVS